jgi:hypothetical protein
LGELTRADITNLIRLVRRDPDLVELPKKLGAIADEMTEEDDVIGGDNDEE